MDIIGGTNKIPQQKTSLAVSKAKVVNGKIAEEYSNVLFARVTIYWHGDAITIQNTFSSIDRIATLS